MGVVNLPQKGTEKTQEAGKTQGSPNNQDIDEWEIVFKGFEFRVNKKGKALIHESGCLNIRSREEYLIQIDVEDKSVDEFWEKRQAKIRGMKKAGNTFELEPQKITVDKKEYIEYRLKSDNKFYEVLIGGAGQGKRIWGIAVFDGIDMAKLNEKQQAAYYEEAISEMTSILAKAKPTDKKNDIAGAAWEEKVQISDITEVTITKEEIAVSYKLPEGYTFCTDNITGKGYHSEQDGADVLLSIIYKSSSTAKEHAQSKSLAGISQITSQGQCTINGITFYYYSYSVKWMEEDEEKYEYKFEAFADLEGDGVFSISGYSQTNPEIMNAEYYKTFMEINESKRAETTEN